VDTIRINSYPLKLTYGSQPMKVCVVHNTLNSVGGGERVCLAIIETLKELGHKVTLLTVEPTNWEYVERVVGDAVRPDEEVSLLSFRLRAFGIYMRLLTFLIIIRSRGTCDLVVNTHGGILPITSDIIYMHFPTFALIKEAPNIKYSKSLFWRLYFLPYEKIQSWLVKRRRWRILLTNSEFSREAIRRHIGTNAEVLYPPVDVHEFLKVSESRSRVDRVISCGRYTPEKNYEFILRIAKELPHIEFVIMGAYSGRISSAYYSKLVRLKEKLRLKNVKLLRSVPRDEQLKIYSNSKVFLHAMVGEHFGVAVVEGMAAGLVPVVHKSGGPWYDIVDGGKYGLGYLSVEEAIDAISKAINSYWRLRNVVLERARAFSKEKFKQEFKEIMLTFTFQHSAE